MNKEDKEKLVSLENELNKIKENFDSLMLTVLTDFETKKDTINKIVINKTKMIKIEEEIVEIYKKSDSEYDQELKSIMSEFKDLTEKAKEKGLIDLNFEDLMEEIINKEEPKEENWWKEIQKR